MELKARRIAVEYLFIILCFLILFLIVNFLDSRYPFIVFRSDQIMKYEVHLIISQLIRPSYHIQHFNYTDLKSF